IKDFSIDGTGTQTEIINVSFRRIPANNETIDAPTSGFDTVSRTRHFQITFGPTASTLLADSLVFSYDTTLDGIDDETTSELSLATRTSSEDNWTVMSGISINSSSNLIIYSGTNLELANRQFVFISKFGGSSTSCPQPADLPNPLEQVSCDTLTITTGDVGSSLVFPDTKIRIVPSVITDDGSFTVKHVHHAYLNVKVLSDPLDEFDVLGLKEYWELEALDITNFDADTLEISEIEDPPDPEINISTLAVFRDDLPPASQGWENAKISHVTGGIDYNEIDMEIIAEDVIDFSRWGIAIKDSSDVIAPVELSYFKLKSDLQNNSINLEWQTHSEIDNQGFEILRKDEGGTFKIIASYSSHKNLIGAGNSSNLNDYALSDKAVLQNKIYYYKLLSVDFDGTVHDYGTLKGVLSDEIFENDLRIPLRIKLAQNFPNPFNPTTSIDFEISKPFLVKISVFNLKGQLVNEIFNEVAKAGSNSVFWNGTDEKGKQVSSGTYFYKLESGNFSETKKMVLLK
ncbi:T9SS type A sorting domain-containing protein, partial [bacterium]|nr:T9SS type A sorting domain-containing protein [bacterium]